MLGPDLLAPGAEVILVVEKAVVGDGQACSETVRHIVEYAVVRAAAACASYTIDSRARGRTIGMGIKEQRLWARWMNCRRRWSIVLKWPETHVAIKRCCPD
jgi:hypothetical protein